MEQKTTRATRVYVAGKMRGVKWFNFLAFDTAKCRLTTLGFDVVSPADIDRACNFDAMLLPEDTDWGTLPAYLNLKEIMARDIDALESCDAIYVMLDGVTQSEGAQIEIAHARRTDKVFLMDCDSDDYLLARAVTPVEDVAIPPPAVKETRVTADGCRYTERGGVLDEAKSLICGDRNASYGPPSQDFQRTADMMNALFGWMLKDGCRFKARDVAWVMMFVKASRAQHSPKRDNYVDAAGYAACGWECEAEASK